MLDWSLFNPDKKSPATMTSHLLFGYLLITLFASLAASAPESSPGTLMSKAQPLDLIEQLDVDMSSDLDKRSRQYSFGLGKKSSDDEWGLSDPPMDTYEALWDTTEGKRAEPARFGFGLGKKASKSSNGPESRFSFGLGKRAAQRQYSFGLGKRPMLRYGPGKKAANRFAFGLGKRDFTSVDGPSGREGEDFNKRRYSFGLGKRGPSASQRYVFGLGRR